MPLDTSIPLRINPVQLPDFNALAQQRLSNVSNMMAITAQQKAMQEQEAIKAAYQGALDPQTRQIDYDKLIAGVAPIKPDLIPQIQQHRAQEQEAKQKSIEFGQKQIGTQFQTALNDPSDETLAHVKANLTAFGMPAEALDAELEPIMKLPVDQRHGAIFNRLAADPQTREALKFTMPDPKETNLGGTVAFIDMNPNSPTFKQTLSEKQVTMSQYQRAELGGQAAARAETARHNRKEELNAAGSDEPLSADALEIAAENYRQFGTLPAMGIGKQGAANKRAIMNRAGALARTSQGGILNASNAAGTMVTGKQTVAAQTSALRDFSGGMSARKVTALNSVLEHGATLQDATKALANGNIPLFNSISQSYAKQTGSAVPTNFDAVKRIYAAEAVKAVIANGGGELERQAAENAISRASSPQQLAGIIATNNQLFTGQLHSLQQQYESGTGRKDFQKKLTPRAKALLTTGGSHAGPSVSNW